MASANTLFHLQQRGGKEKTSIRGLSTSEQTNKKGSASLTGGKGKDDDFSHRQAEKEKERTPLLSPP